jgi:hypothetical protein
MSTLTIRDAYLAELAQSQTSGQNAIFSEETLDSIGKTRIMIDAVDNRNLFARKFLFDLHEETEDFNNMSNFTAKLSSTYTSTSVRFYNYTDKTTTSGYAYTGATDFLKFLSGQVFGSESFSDLFNNSGVVKDDWMKKNGAALKQEITSSMYKLNYYSNGDVSKTIMKYLINQTPERFGMEYNAVTDLSDNSVFADGEDSKTFDSTYVSKNASQGSTAAELSITVDRDDNNANNANYDILSDGNKISTILVTKAGSGYKEGGTLNVTYKANTTTYAVTINKINSVQAAMLNGETTNIILPLEVGDQFLVKFETAMADNQTNANGEDIGVVGAPTQKVSVLIELIEDSTT